MVKNKRETAERKQEEEEGDKGSWVHAVWASCCIDSIVKLESRGTKVRENEVGGGRMMDRESEKENWRWLKGEDTEEDCWE